MPLTVDNPFIHAPDYFDRKITAMWVSGKDTSDVLRNVVTHGVHPTLGPAGRQGIWNAQGGVKGLYDAPIKTTWKTGAFQDGSTQKAKKWLHRDLDMAFHAIETITMLDEDTGTLTAAEENESNFRSLFGYDLDEYDDNPLPATMHVLTDMSGERKLDVLMHKEPTIEPDIDPVLQQYFNTILALRAGQPFWYEDDVVTFDESTATSGVLTVTVSNPTDQPMRHKWVLTRGTFQVPDFSWRGGRGNRHPAGTFQNRRIPVTVTADNGGAVISLNKSRDLMIRDLNAANNLLPELGGRLFQHVIPPYTQEQTLTIPYLDAPVGGARVELHQPRLWSRPWGLE